MTQPPNGVPPVPPAASTPGGEPADARTMAMLCHLLAIPLGFIGPLIIWLLKKQESQLVDDQGKEALNFQLTVLIAYIVGALTVCLFIGFVIIPIVIVADLILCIMAAMAANKGERYRYPVNIRFIK